MKRIATLAVFSLAAAGSPAFAEGPVTPPHAHDASTAQATAGPVLNIPAQAQPAVATVERFSTALVAGRLDAAGAEAVAAWWKKYYEGKEAPFSWEPAQVEVLESGTLALSTGPVRDPAGTQTGTFTSIWRREGPGRWRIVFDKGNPVCPKEP